jgi:hypothetical protein
MGRQVLFMSGVGVLFQVALVGSNTFIVAVDLYLI